MLSAADRALLDQLLALGQTGDHNTGDEDGDDGDQDGYDGDEDDCDGDEDGLMVMRMPMIVVKMQTVRRMVRMMAMMLMMPR